MRLLAALTMTVCVGAQQDERLRRLAEEAEAFAAGARDLLAEETLRQRALKGPPRFRPRVVTKQPKLRYQAREIVSEYGYSVLQESPDAVHEFRKVVSVDGKPAKGGAKARETLTLGLRSEDDRVKKQLLRDFEKHGLVGAATDFGQILLLFRKRSIGGYVFEPAGVNRLGADAVTVYRYYQQDDGAVLTIFEGREAIRRRLAGEVWMRDRDSMPLRITVGAARKDGNHVIRDEASVDYTPSSHGMLVPASVVHRQYVGDVLAVENVFQYGAFRRFGAAAEIKFTEAPDPPPPLR